MTGHRASGPRDDRGVVLGSILVLVAGCQGINRSQVRRGIPERIQ